jgi:pyruvate dehydrogenase E2 component (dihydrolipoamide acetyltransferase)
MAGEGGRQVSSGDILAEIETDKATMEFEAVDEGTIAKILVAEGTDGVKVGEPIAILAGEGEDVKRGCEGGACQERAERRSDKSEAAGEEGAAKAARVRPSQGSASRSETFSSPSPESPHPKLSREGRGRKIKASPLARRIAENKGIDLSAVEGSGPAGGSSRPISRRRQAPRLPPPAAPAPAPAEPGEIPHEAVKLSNMRKTIARRLTEAKQTIPHIYLTVDIQLDALLKLRGELNAGLEAAGSSSVNDLLIKALAAALVEVPECNVSFAGDQLIKYSRADISVAVSIPGGLITPIIVDAGGKTVSAIAPR